MTRKVTVKAANDIDHTNAHYVTVADDIIGNEHHTVWTGPKGNGLWIDGRQVEGNAQFSAGKNAAAAIRKYFSK